jgi:capsular polysaccharide biosynthesis protein
MTQFLWIFYSKLRIGIYRSSIYPPHKKRLKNVEGPENIIENEPYFSTKNVILMDEFKGKLDKCSKSGGYKKYFGKWIWVNHKIKYFPQEEKNIVYWGGVPNFITKAKLVYLENSIIYPNKYPGNYNQKYTFYIKQNKVKTYDIEKAISFNIGGANSFQHFMQDCLPIIVKSRKFLQENPDILILIPKANNNFVNRGILLDKIGITNKIIETDQITSLKVRVLYFWNFTPYNSKYNLPPIFNKDLREIVKSKINVIENRSIVLLVRSEKMRKFKTNSEIIKCLKALSDLNNLALEVIDTSFEDINAVSNKLKKAVIIIGIVGGNTYNAIFCPDDCTVIEIVPTQNTDSNINFLSYAGIRYIPFPLEFKHSDEVVDVPTEELAALVAKVLSKVTKSPCL